ncbi:unnamed protein product, partial [Ectocarpus fasciculatus]
QKRNLERAVQKLEDISEERRRVWTEDWERRLEGLRQAVTVAGEAALGVAKENLDIAKAGLCGDHNTMEPGTVRDMLSPVVQEAVLLEMDRIQEIAQKADKASCTLEDAVGSLTKATEDGEIQRHKGEKHRELLDTERKKLKKVEKEWRKTMEDFEFLEGKEAQAKEAFNAAKSIVSAKKNDLKEATKADNNAKSRVGEIRQVEADIAQELRDCAELPMHAASRQRLVAEYADWERVVQEEADSARDEEQRLEEETDDDDEQLQMCHDLEAVQDAYHDEATDDFGGDNGYPGNNNNNAEPPATRQAEVGSEPSRNKSKVSSNQNKDRRRRLRREKLTFPPTVEEDDRPRRRYHPDEQQEEEDEEHEEDEWPISTAHQANVQRRSSKGKGTGGKPRMAASSQAISWFEGAQQRQARTVDHQTVATGNSKGKGKARSGAIIARQDDAASHANISYGIPKAVPRTGLHAGRQILPGGLLGSKRKTPTASEVADEDGTGQRTPAYHVSKKKRVHTADPKASLGLSIEEGGKRANPRFGSNFRKRSSSSPSVSRTPEAVADTSSNDQTGAYSEANAVATTTTEEATTSTGKVKEPRHTDSTSETPAALARVELSCKTEHAKSEGASEHL